MGLPFEIDVAAIEQLPAHEREEVRAQLEELESRAASNPLWGYVPHDKQLTYHGIEAPVGAFVGGNRSGKSTGGTVDDLVQVLPVELLPPWLLPFKRWHGECFRRVGTPKIATTLEPVVLPLFRRLTPKAALWKGSWDKAYNDRLRTLQFADGNRIDFLTYDMDLDAWSGAALHGIRLDEEPKGNHGRSIYEECLMRLIDHAGEFRMTFTPLFGLSWSYHELTRQGAPRWDEEVQVVTVDIDDNPHLDTATKTRVLGKIPLAMRAARKSGRFVHFAGLIYPEFNPDLHVVPDVQVAPPRGEDGVVAVPVYEAIDPGRDHPTAVLLGWVDSEVHALKVFDGFKVSGLNAEEVSAEIHRRRRELRYKPRWSVIDPSARNKQHATGRSIQDVYRRQGVYTIPGQNSRLAGYDRVSELLKADPARLLVGASVECLIGEFPEYRWKTPKGGETIGNQEPVKINDDALDALRYLVMSNPTGLRTAAELDDPGPEPGKADEWHRRQLAAQHLKRLVKRRKGGKAGGRLGAVFR